MIAAADLATRWDPQAGVLAVAFLGVVLFSQGFVRLRRRGRRDLAPWSRAALFAAGTALAVFPLVSPLDAAGEDYLLSAHMLQHVLIADAAVALLVLSVRGPLLFFLIPARILRMLAPLRPLRALLRFLLRPAVAFVVWTIVILAWHLPAAYDAADAHPAVHVLEHTCFVAAGLLVWTQLIDPARTGRLTRGERVAYAVGLFVAAQPVMDVLLFNRRAVYPHYAHLGPRLWGISPVTDQRLAAAVMFVEQVLTLGTLICVLLLPGLRASESVSPSSTRAAGRRPRRAALRGAGRQPDPESRSATG